ncbi:G-protein coupled receptor 55 [Triplophysa rosa]|uniref:G-protein coupled receptor 55-like n=1 Tax=Triplophysa rosa TaxID=992332 RepID=A0A9W7WAM5_TRIRA|nr:G-protein coupled receptor 55 [Triplophysa rosa]XP_057181056.1 G-protein coupled receptor 55 [Triplophysa rosa]KAI7791118.1 putative G-protein coupled receptor 55-like [Triplophysa rosa]
MANVSNMSTCNLTITDGIKSLQLATSIPTFILGVLGNIYVFVMFCRHPRKDWTNMMIYITNMAIADCIVLTILPIRIASYYHASKNNPTLQELWNSSNKELCYFLVSAYYVNMYISIFTMTAISVVRYVAIKYPLKARYILSRKKALVVCALIWVVNCSLSAVFHYADNPKNQTTDFKCFQKNQEGALPLSFILVLTIVGFLLPFLIMLYCSAKIIHTLRKQLDIGSRADKIQCMFIITANLIVFVICFFPVHFGFLFKYIWEKRESNCDMQNFAHNFVHGAMCFSIMNCGLDSFSYYFANKTKWNMCGTNQRNDENCVYNRVELRDKGYDF